MTAQSDISREGEMETGDEIEHAADCQSHIVDVRGRPDECTCGALPPPPSKEMGNG